MRPVLCLIMLLSYAVHAQSTPDPFEITQRIAENGAPQLALARVEQLQPAAATAPRWTDWEQLRCVLLGRLMRYEELSKRVDALPSGVPDQAVRACLLQGARRDRRRTSHYRAQLARAAHVAAGAVRR
jgi:hypothetical protein